MGMGAMGGVSGMGSMGMGGAAVSGGAMAGGAGAASAACSSGAASSTQAAQTFNQVDTLLSNLTDKLAGSQFLKLALAMMLMENLDGCDDHKHRHLCEDLGLVGALALSAALAGDRIESATQAAQAQHGASLAYTNQAVQATGAMGASLNIMA